MQTSFLSQVSGDNNVSKELHIATEPEAARALRQAFQFWRGRHTFAWGGKLVMGPAEGRLGSWVFAGAVLALTAVFYEVILPVLDTNNRVQLGVGFGICVGMLAVFSVLTALTEPGLIPQANFVQAKALLNLESAESRQIMGVVSGKPVTFDTPLQPTQDPQAPAQPPVADAQPPASNDKAASVQNEDKPSSKLGMLDSLSVVDPTKSKRYCAACKVFKPPRAYHCAKCNACVRGFSHHCLLVNNCIGKRNYKYFILMILAGFLVDGYFVTCLILYHERANAASRYLYKLTFFVTIFQAILVLGFCAFYLIGFVFTGGNRRLPSGVRDGAPLADLDERNDFWTTTPGLIHWDKTVTSEEEKELTAVYD